MPRNDVPKIIDGILSKQTLGLLEKELIGNQTLENNIQMRKMLLQGFTVDQYVVKEDYNKSSQMWLELEMANEPVPVGIVRTRPRFDGESPH